MKIDGRRTQYRKFSKKDLNALDIDEVLDHFLVDYRYKAGEPYFLCPDPDHSDNSPSFSINVSRDSDRLGLGNCLSCGWGGSFYTIFSQLCENDGIVERAAINELLFRFVDGRSIEEDPDFLEFNDDSDESTYASKDLAIDLPEVEVDRFKDLKTGDPFWRYLLGRGFTADQVAKDGWMRAGPRADLKWKGRAILPLTVDNRVVCLFGRAISKQRDPKTLMSKGKGLSSSVLHPFDRLDFSRPVVLVEGVPDAASVENAGAQGCAVFKNRVSLEQAHMLRRIRKIFVCADGDDGGDVLIQSAIKRLRPRDGLFICQAPYEQDPNDLTRNQIRKHLVDAKSADDYPRAHVRLNRAAISYETK